MNPVVSRYAGPASTSRYCSRLSRYAGPASTSRYCSRLLRLEMEVVFCYGKIICLSDYNVCFLGWNNFCLNLYLYIPPQVPWSLVPPCTHRHLARILISQWQVLDYFLDSRKVGNCLIPPSQTTPLSYVCLHLKPSLSKVTRHRYKSWPTTTSCTINSFFIFIKALKY